MDAHPVNLAMVAVAGTVLTNVQAIVMPSRLVQGVDGLLGMTFLKEFIIQIDPANNKLTLTRFSPK